MSLSAEALILQLHGALLRELADATSQDFAGLEQAARFCRRNKLIDNNTAKRLAHLDHAFNYVRHITKVKADLFLSFIRELTSGKAFTPDSQSHAAAADELPRQSQHEEADELPRQSQHEEADGAAGPAGVHSTHAQQKAAAMDHALASLTAKVEQTLNAMAAAGTNLNPGARAFVPAAHAAKRPRLNERGETSASAAASADIFVGGDDALKSTGATSLVGDSCGTIAATNERCRAAAAAELSTVDEMRLDRCRRLEMQILADGLADPCWSDDEF
eukprot:CAMPEP_0172841250 /NCGR_PEP_ID=MMETSP1075-20121228/29879_1 /TAXON_ID=2916 /ORGANISM="Ceratium fusus, Strain PA161109" /LENGTH=274 /DNA_ID=CAMNT_0013685207 /DNA_START=58 /DNA_END=882 /DNA_ORIENTATION=-